MRYLTPVALLLILACDDGGGGPSFRSSPTDASIARDGGLDGRASDSNPSPDGAVDGATTAPDGATLDGTLADGPLPDAYVPPGLPAANWPLRSCAVTVRYEAPAGMQVLLAGEFTDWADGALPMEHDGAGYVREVGPEDGLVPGELNAYKLVVDGAWRIDPEASHHEYVGGCANSAIRAPDCAAGPEIVGEPVTDTVAATLHAASDGAPLVEATMTLDGDPLPFTVDADSGRLGAALPELPPGRHVVQVRATDADGREAAPVDLVFWREETPFDYRDGILFMFLVDRFANGDRGIDDPAPEPVTYPSNWHGGDLWGALEVLESGYLETLGVTSVWISPLNRQADGDFEGRDGPQRFTGYHGYWPSRAREVEPRFGGNEALLAFVAAAHERGIRVLLDLINNQVHDQHEYVGPHPEWFRTACVCGTEGCGWSERPLDCLFAPYLPDIDWTHPGAAEQFISDAVWWVETFGVDGFRVDAVKHVETSSIYNLRAELARRFEQGGTRVVMLGETAVGEGDRWDDGCGEIYPSGYAWIEAYTGHNALDGQFDFPTHHRVQWGLLSGEGSFEDIDAALRDGEARYGAEALHVRFLGSHDSNRMASRAANDPSAGCRFVGEGCPSLPATVEDPAALRRLRRAWTLLLTTPGLPLLYYGDEIAMAGGNDPDNRRDMLWDGDLAELSMSVRIPTAGQLGLREWLQRLAAVRAAHPALRRGARRTLSVDPNLYVYERTLGGDRVVVVLNRGEARDLQVDAGMSVLAGGGALDGATLHVDAGDAVLLGVSE